MQLRNTKKWTKKPTLPKTGRTQLVSTVLYHVYGVKMKCYGNLQQWSIETHLLRQIEKHEQGIVRVLALRRKGIVCVEMGLG